MKIDKMNGEVAALLEDRLKLRGKGLRGKLGHRNFPSEIRAEAEFLVRAATEAQSPKLSLQLERGRIAAAHATCIAFLQPIGRRERRIDTLLSIAASAAFVLLVVFGVAVALLRWQGHL